MVSKQDARWRADIGEHARQLLAVAERDRVQGEGLRATNEQAQQALRELGGIDRSRLVARQALTIAVLRSRLLAAGVATDVEVDALIDPGLARLTAGSARA
jgi:hypothetical protein